MWKIKREDSSEQCMTKNAAGFPGGSAVKNLPAVQETQEMQVRSLSGEDPLK